MVVSFLNVVRGREALGKKVPLFYCCFSIPFPPATTAISFHNLEFTFLASGPVDSKIMSEGNAVVEGGRDRKGKNNKIKGRVARLPKGCSGREAREQCAPARRGAKRSAHKQLGFLTGVCVWEPWGRGA